ncbi:MAG: adenylosuccinate synthase [Flavobacteriales bacterium]|nr:adenylosuccinate synthase [Bacteroidota bacterium]MCB9241742.1 adenylosuccinate synthase [Flavobacteriales bacterium]
MSIGYVDVVLGLQWGDEGKGKIADFLTPKYDVVARFQGGPNAGHSLEMNGVKHVLNTIPSGIFHENCINLIGNGVVIDPVRLMDEIDRTITAGADVRSNLYISRKANLILPTHKLLDAASEEQKGDQKIGSTLRGIGPTYRDKYGRNGLRTGDIFHPNFKAMYQKVADSHMKHLRQFGSDADGLEHMEQEFFAAVDRLREFKFVESEYFVHELIKSGKRILAEGAQGSMLDIDFGSYPFVTSSNTISGGVTVGLGVAPKYIRKVMGIFKAYCTRVGGGPFPTELNDPIGEQLRKAGHEYGATTGRPRRCGWLDLVALNYAVMLSGVDELIMMKSDVMSGMEEVCVATAYRLNGTETNQVPHNYVDVDLEPVYTSHPGWSEDISQHRSESQFPETFRNYISWLEEQLDVPIKVISIGPDRVQTVVRETQSA